MPIVISPKGQELQTNDHSVKYLLAEGWKLKAEEKPGKEEETQEGHKDESEADKASDSKDQGAAEKAGIDPELIKKYEEKYGKKPHHKMVEATIRAALEA